MKTSSRIVCVGSWLALATACEAEPPFEPQGGTVTIGSDFPAGLEWVAELADGPGLDPADTVGGGDANGGSGWGGVDGAVGVDGGGVEDGASGGNGGNGAPDGGGCGAECDALTPGRGGDEGAAGDETGPGTGPSGEAGTGAVVLNPAGGVGWSVGVAGLGPGKGVPKPAPVLPLSLEQDRSCVACSMACSDDDACTFDVPNAGGQCLHLGYYPTCAMSQGCGAGTICAGDYCVGRALDCRDGDPCTADACDPATGACANVPIPGCAGAACAADADCPVDAFCTEFGRCAPATAAFQPSGPSYPKPASVRRIITYNLLYGLKSNVSGYSPKRGKQVTAWLAAMQPDVVALQECNAWTPAVLHTLAQSWGHTHAVIRGASSFQIGVTSKRPIEVVAFHEAPFKIGVLHVRIEGTELLVAHLNFGNFGQRMAEAKKLGALVASLRAQGREVLVLGDFNALSPYDMGYYAIETPEPWYAAFAPAAQPAGGPSALEFQQLTGYGLVDVVAALRSSPLVSASHQLPNAPWGLRVDHALATPGLISEMRHAWIADAPQRRAWSDHSPVVLDMNAP